MTPQAVNIITRTFRALLIAAVPALGACSSAADAPDMPAGDTAPACSIGLYVRLGDGEPASRTTPDDGSYASGTTGENYIDLDGDTPDMRLYAFTTDNRLIREFDGPEITPMSSSPTSKTYELKFNVDRDFYDSYSGKSFKIMMLANWRRYPDSSKLVPGTTTIDDITTAAEATSDIRGFGGCPGPYITGEQRIPMFGIAQYDKITLVPNMLVMLGDLHLLRAYAKIEVYDDAASDDTLTGVSLTRHNVRSAMAPRGVYHQDDYVKHSYNDDYAATLTVPDASETSDALAMVRDSVSGHFIVYVPEYRNTGRSDGERARLLLHYKFGEKFYADFKYYQNPAPGSAVGDAFDIRRNYWYKYEIKRNGTTIQLTADVLPYGTVKLEPSFGLD